LYFAICAADIISAHATLRNTFLSGNLVQHIPVWPSLAVRFKQPALVVFSQFILSMPATIDLCDLIPDPELLEKE
jgi:hypothetical protein